MNKNKILFGLLNVFIILSVILSVNAMEFDCPNINDNPPTPYTCELIKVSIEYDADFINDFFIVNSHTILKDSPLYTWITDPSGMNINIEVLYPEAVSTTTSTATGNLTGTVTNSSGGYLAGVDIVIIGLSGKTATTDANGYYLISDANVGSHTVTFTLNGYDTIINSSIIITDGAATTLDNIMYIDTTPPTATGNLTGTITNSSGGALVGVTVDVGSLSTTTNANGEYTISDIGVGSYTVTFSKTNYTSIVNLSIPITDGGLTILDNIMNLDTTPTSGNTVTITLKKEGGQPMDQGVVVDFTFYDDQGVDKGTFTQQSTANGDITFSKPSGFDDGDYDIGFNISGYVVDPVKKVKIAISGNQLSPRSGENNIVIFKPTGWSGSECGGGLVIANPLDNGEIQLGENIILTMDQTKKEDFMDDCSLEFKKGQNQIISIDQDSEFSQQDGELYSFNTGAFNLVSGDIITMGILEKVFGQDVLLNTFTWTITDERGKLKGNIEFNGLGTFVLTEDKVTINLIKNNIVKITRQPFSTFLTATEDYEIEYIPGDYLLRVIVQGYEIEKEKTVTIVDQNVQPSPTVVDFLFEVADMNSCGSLLPTKNNNDYCKCSNDLACFKDDVCYLDGTVNKCKPDSQISECPVTGFGKNAPIEELDFSSNDLCRCGVNYCQTKVSNFELICYNDQSRSGSKICSDEKDKNDTEAYLDNPCEENTLAQDACFCGDNLIRCNEDQYCGVDSGQGSCTDIGASCTDLGLEKCGPDMSPGGTGENDKFRYECKNIPIQGGDFYEKRWTIVGDDDGDSIIDNPGQNCQQDEYCRPLAQSEHGSITVTECVNWEQVCEDKDYLMVIMKHVDGSSAIFNLVSNQISIDRRSDPECEFDPEMSFSQENNLIYYHNLPYGEYSITINKPPYKDIIKIGTVTQDGGVIEIVFEEEEIFGLNATEMSNLAVHINSLKNGIINKIESDLETLAKVTSPAILLTKTDLDSSGNQECAICPVNTGNIKVDVNINYGGTLSVGNDNVVNVIISIYDKTDLSKKVTKEQSYSEFEITDDMIK